MINYLRDVIRISATERTEGSVAPTPAIAALVSHYLGTLRAATSISGSGPRAFVLHLRQSPRYGSRVLRMAGRVDEIRQAQAIQRERAHHASVITHPDNRFRHPQPSSRPRHSPTVGTLLERAGTHP